MSSFTAERRAIVPSLRTEKLPECMSLRVGCLESLEPYSFNVKPSYHGSEIRMLTGSRDGAGDNR